MRKKVRAKGRTVRITHTNNLYRRRTAWPAASVVRRSSPTRTTKRIAPEKSFFVLHDCYGTCIPGLEVAYDNEGSSGHGWRLDSKICEVLALTARAFCGSISLQIEIDSHNCSQIFSFAFAVMDFSAWCDTLSALTGRRALCKTGNNWEYFRAIGEC
jgi:hypothetical protein